MDYIITPAVLRELQETDKNFIILDVREPWELEKACFSGALNISLGQLKEKMADIPETDLIITVCHHGIRSLKAAHFLMECGKKAKSLKGGIDAYAREIDPSIPLY